MQISPEEKGLLLGAMLRELRGEAATLEIKAPGYSLGELRRAVTALLARVERVKFIVDNYEGL